MRLRRLFLELQHRGGRVTLMKNYTRSKGREETI